MKKSTIATLLVTFAMIPLTLFVGTKMPGRWYYLTCTAIIVELLVPFLLAFEGRKPQARELVVVAVLCAIATVSRLVVPVPHFKPIFAIIMLSGIAFGPETGFLVGAVSALASNLFYMQGPYLPWQMMAYGMGGLLAGAVFTRFSLPKKPWVMAVFGFFCCILVIGPLLDLCTAVLSLTEFSVETLLTMLGSGFMVNVSQGSCTVLTMLIFGRPLLEKLDRIKLKYGMMEDEDGL